MRWNRIVNSRIEGRSIQGNRSRRSITLIFFSARKWKMRVAEASTQHQVINGLVQRCDPVLGLVPMWAARVSRARSSPQKQLSPGSVTTWGSWASGLMLGFSLRNPTQCSRKLTMPYT